MPEITDQFMHDSLANASEFTVVIFSKGPNYSLADAPAIGWDHGKRNMSLRLTGELNVVVRFIDEGDVRGIGIFHLPMGEVQTLLAEDPAIRKGVLTVSYRSGLSFPGDRLR